MAITTAFPTSAKAQYMTAIHDLTNSTGDTVKYALYTSSATLGASTTAYSATNETSGTGYTAAGNTLTNVTPTTSGTTAYADFNDTQWTTSTITARGGLGYNDTDSDAALVVNDFGSDKSSTSGTFTVTFPTADASNAIIRIA